MRTPPSTNERRTTLADFLNFYNHERPHSALDGRPPISRTDRSDYRVVFALSPEPLDPAPQQLAFEDLVDPTS
ncbi:integrase core domain-containing protein [Streptomyces venezuelae]|uniref:integrase core domain-containing protein n=1 Tax=Streptomyces venezuelae TaxID=54571 RepID=UPI00343E554B